MPQKHLLSILFVIMPVLCIAQRMQRIKGHIADKESKVPLIGVTVAVTDITPAPGGVTDENGNFVIDSVPVGKHTLTVSYIGYEGRTLNDVLVTSAKEVIMPLELEEKAVKMDAVTITYKREHINEMALVSTRTFDVQETERYAGSRNDPARMASNFAGAQGGDDSRNDIVIRGNSPQGVLWRLEGVNIPNPNHFSIPGTTGGPVSMLNDKTLANSDFYMGAFPAEYGDAVAGVFDVRLRNGNNDRYEFSCQLGILGTELAAEGPISRKSGSSFLFTYRYSTLDLFQGLHIKIGTTSVPRYQDATFKVNFPVGKKGDFSVFGIGGLSNIDLIVSNLKEQTTQLYGESDRDQYFTSNTGIVGASYGQTINSSTYTKITVAQTANDIYAEHDYVFRNPVVFTQIDSPLKPILGYRYTTATTAAHWYVNKKLSPRHTLKFGIVNDLYNVNFIDSSRQYPPTQQQWAHREDYKGSTDLVQAYIQSKYRTSEQFTFTAGLHAQYFTLNGSKSIEPRVGLKWALSNTDILTAGYGLHSELQPLYQYFTNKPNDPNKTLFNKDMGFTRSHHIMTAYEKAIGKAINMRLEAYGQYLFNVPIEIKPGSSYSALDQGSGYSRYFPDTLQNKGTGYNYGLELTLEKKFSNGYYILLTGSVFDSKAAGNDGVYRNTDYNSHFAANALAGYEKKVGKYGIFIAGIKTTVIGGKPYSPVNAALSDSLGDAVVIESQRNSLQFKNYFRADLKLGYRLNSKKVTHEIAVDLVNVFNTKNILSYTYSYELYRQTNGAEPFYYQYQLGFLPLFYYKIDFGIKRK